MITRTPAFSDILRGLDDFLSLCGAVGLNREVTASRFSVYRVRLQRLSKEIEGLRAGEPRDQVYPRLRADLPWYLVALFESQEIGTILPFVQSRDPGEINHALKAVLSGPEMPSDENQALNQARNIQFELWLATTLWRAGAAVALREPDLECTIGDTRILVACKRLFSERKLNKRINEATKQLWHAVRATSATGGIIAISLSRVLGATDRSQQTATRPEAMEMLRSRIENVVQRRAKWQHRHEAQGILFHLASMFTNLATDRIESGSFITMYGDGPVAISIAQALQSVAD